MRHFRFILIPAVLFLLAGYASAGWVQQPSGTTANLNRVFFIDPQIGWVAGDSNFVLRTTDGGTNWVRNNVDTSVHWFRALWFQDPENGWVGGTARGGRYSGLLYSTTDGGVNWQLMKKDSFGISYQDVKFTTPQKGWLVGAIFSSGGGGAGFLFQTTDEGGTWALKDSSSEIYWEVSFADTLSGLLAAGIPNVIGTESSGLMKRTTDGGTAWQPFDQGYTMFSSIRFTDNNYAWRSEFLHLLSDNSWRIAKTTNRGGSWTGILSGQSLGSVYPRLAVVDTQKGWVLKTDTLFNTRDAGATWSWQIPPGNYLHDLFFTDSLNGWLVGGNGLILHTTDGGSGVWENPQGSFKPLISNLSFSVSPNPFTSFASVLGHERERFALYDVSGRRVGVYKGDRIGEGLRAGVYFLRAEGGEGRPVRIVKVR